ncbi:MAG: YbbR-like domain-containing protein [Verrucomicrobiota bacterium]
MKFRIPTIIKRDFWRKSVALFFAVLTWLAVNNRLQEYETFHDIPVTLRYRSDKIIVTQKVFTSDITLRGSQHQLESISTSDIHITANIPIVPEGVYYYDLHLTPGNVNTPPGLEVARIDPGNLRIPIDRIITREVPVKIQEAGDLPYGYKIVDRRIVPSQVSISGPSKVIDEIDRVETETVVLDEKIDEDFEIEDVKVLSIADTTVNPNRVHVKYEIGRIGADKTFTEVPIRVLSNAFFKIENVTSLPKVNVTIKGTKSALKDIDVQEVIPFLDLSKAEEPGENELPVFVWLPSYEDIYLSTVEPENVSVDLRWRSDLIPDSPRLRFSDSPAQK